ncbi:MAG: hypothetical protein FGF50_08075 [Candidatus Brockarchaeota archaeon]|nr:hypothetical protein [Candidatus Brockarchaeota archaeon]
MIDSRGQMRIVEALLASGIIAVAMWSMINLTRAPDPYSAKVKSEAEKYCYDFLMSLADREVYDEVIFNSTGVRQGWEGLMKNVLNALLPANTLYNMTIYNMSQKGDIVEVEPLGESISNASPDDFRLAKESAGADITYTTRRRWVLKIHLELAKRW